MQKTAGNQDLSCPQCLCQNLLRDQYNGEVVCGDCGLVIIEDMLDRGPEWRSFTLEDQQAKRRVGAPIKYSDICSECGEHCEIIDDEEELEDGN